MRRLRSRDMRSVAVLFGLTVLAACGGTAANPPPPSASASQQASRPCRLPFTDFKTAGFINYPDGTFTADPSSAITPDPGRPGFGRTVTTPVLTGVAGNGNETYDWKFSRWLPAAHELVSPDGSQYAYSEVIPNQGSQGIGGPPALGTLIHVVDVVTATDRVVYQSTDQLSAAAFGPEGIYLFQPAEIANTVRPFYLWLVDPSTHAAHKLLGGKVVGPGTGAITAGTFWIMATDPNNPKGAPTLLRMDLNDGSQSTWYEPTTTFAGFLGLDSLGRPIVSTFSGSNGDPGKTWIVTAAGAMHQIAEVGFSAKAIADPHGSWLAGQGLFLYSAAGGLSKVSDVSGGSILGTCG
jgi:hypothetical protein